MSENEPIHIEFAETPAPPVVLPDDRPKLEPPMTISIAEQSHQDDLRARSIQLARERWHLRS